jgi:hypothetical protein
MFFKKVKGKLKNVLNYKLASICDKYENVKADFSKTDHD